MEILKKGDKAPKFELRNQYGEKVSSEDIKGKYLLSFHPLAFTAVCTDQMRELERNYDRLMEAGITPFGVSVDAYPSKGVWAKAISVDNVQLLSDFNPTGGLGKELGIFVEKAGIDARSAFVIEGDKILWSRLYEESELPRVDDFLKEM